MLDTRIVCPFCSRRLKMNEPVALGDRLRCPHCYHSFDVQSKDFATQAHPETSPVVALPTPFDGTPAPTLPATAPRRGWHPFDASRRGRPGRARAPFPTAQPILTPVDGRSTFRASPTWPRSRSGSASPCTAR